MLEKPAVLTHFQIKISAWDQSDKFVKIYFTSLDGAKEVDASNFELNLTGNKLFFKVSNLKGKNWMFERNSASLFESNHSPAARVQVAEDWIMHKV